MPSNTPIDEEVAQLAFANVFELYIKPEISRRVAAGTLTGKQQVHRAQVILFPDGRSPAVRLNEEVRARAIATLPEGVEGRQEGDTVRIGEVSDWSQIELLDDEDPNCGHITMLRTRTGWAIALDAIYNRDRASQHLERAAEFWNTARLAAAAGHIAPAIDLLWSASELAAKARLLTIADPDVRDSRRHSVIHARYNMEAKLANIPAEFARTYNRLTEERPRARYLQGPVMLTAAELAQDLSTVRDMIDAGQDMLGLRPIEGTASVRRGT